MFSSMPFRTLLAIGLLSTASLVGCVGSATPRSSGPGSSDPNTQMQTDTEPAAAPTGRARVFQIIPDQSEASYDVQEKLAFLPLPSRAVGRTNALEGQFSLTTVPTLRVGDAQFSVDLRTLTSDSGRRDQLIRTRWLESNTYPMAEFRATHVEPMPTSYIEGQEVSVQITGNMTIRTTTRELSFDTRVGLQGDMIRGTGTTFLYMRDFGFDPPNIANAVQVEDGVNLTVSFVAQAQT